MMRVALAALPLALPLLWRAYRARGRRRREPGPGWCQRHLRPRFGLPGVREHLQVGSRSKPHRLRQQAAAPGPLFCDEWLHQASVGLAGAHHGARRGL